MEDKQAKSNISRRFFLKTAGASSAFLALGFQTFGGELMKLKPTEFNPHPLVMLTSEGKVIIMAHKQEIGQGVYQSIPTIIAEELNFTSLDQVQIQLANTATKYGDQSVGGSYSVRGYYGELRKIGASIREMLEKAAANRWNTTIENCYTENSKVFLKTDNSKSLNFSELVEEASKLEVPKEPRLKDPSTFKLVGRPILRPDIALKTNGSAIFGIDMKVEGMLYASVEHSPVYRGKVKSFDDRRAKNVKGVKSIFAVERKLFKNSFFGVAVVADNYFAATEGRKQLRVEWDNTGYEQMSSESNLQQFKDLAKTEGLVYERVGDFDTAYMSAPTKIEAEYETSFAAHVPLEPMNCIAHVKDGECEIWVSTQVPGDVREVVAKMLSLDIEKVKVNLAFVGGGFGRRLTADYVTEAVNISKEVKAPVKMIWTREDDISQSPLRPATYSIMKGALDKDKKVVALHHKVVAPSIGFENFGGKLGEEFDKGALEGFDKSAYSIANQKVSGVYFKTDIPLIWWRSVYSATTAFAHECFIDEMAVAAKKDALQFRLEMIDKDERIKNMLKFLGEKAEWNKKLPTNWGKGIAWWQFFAGQAGHVVYVSKQKDGTMKIEKVVVAIDCGLAVNPDNVKSQVEGGTVMGLREAISNEITFKDGKVEQANFNNYKLLRMNEVPPIEVHIVPNSEVPHGVGEPGLPPVAPALANAIFNLTGKRIRKLPFKLV
jgi:isoquinoline 1-oxidoreductase beta subunit